MIRRFNFKRYRLSQMNIDEETLKKSIKILSENKNTIAEKPIKIPIVFTKLNFSFLV